MHTYNNLFEKIANEDNFLLAIEKAAKGKRKRPSVRRALKNKERIAKELTEMLRQGTWRPVKVHRAIEINDGVTLKKRVIVCPSFKREQIVHHAIFNVVAPLFMRKFYYYSCGSVPGKGKELAVRYVKEQIKNKRKTKYFCKLDIRKFFTNVKPSVAFRALRWVIKDRRVLRLFAYILRCNYIKTVDGTISRAGLPIGLYTSPWIANLVLSQIDHAVKEKYEINVYVRYVDDMILMHSNKRELQRAVSGILQMLSDICLSVKHPPAIHLTDKQKVTFLGVVYTRDKAILASKAFLRSVRIARRIGKKEKFTSYDASRLIQMRAQFGEVDCFKAYKSYIEPVASFKQCVKMVSRKDRYRNGLEKRTKQ